MHPAMAFLAAYVVCNGYCGIDVVTGLEAAICDLISDACMTSDFCLKTLGHLVGPSRDFAYYKMQIMSAR